MAIIQNSYTGSQGTGTDNADFDFTFPSFTKSEVYVEVAGQEQTFGTHYSIENYNVTTGGTVRFTSGNIPTGTTVVRIFRQTAVEVSKATFTAGASLKAGEMNNNFKQVLHGLQESLDRKIKTSDIATDAINGTVIADDAINSEHYVNSSIRTEHIAHFQITTDKLAADSVTGTKLANTSVTPGTYSLADITVDGQGRITAASGSALLPASRLATNAVTTAKIENDAVTGAKIAHDTITFTNLADNCVLRENISNNAVDTDQLKNSSVTTDKLATTSVTGQKIATGAVTHSKLGTASVIHSKLGTNAVETDNIDTYAVTNAKLAANAVGTSKIMDNAVTSAKLADEPLVFANFTTTERDALSSTLRPNGSVIFNTTTNKLQVRVGSSWIDLH